jgi:Pyruvate/2-oxoacid:ferredoxin oxidoreductase delta subunit
MKPVLLKNRCPAQKDMCKAIVACPQGAVVYISDENERLGGRIIFDYEKCDSCGLCASECCGSAIEMREA